MSVLDDEAVACRKSEFLSGQQEDIWRGFAIHHIIPADHRYGGIKKNALKRRRELDKENARLKRAVADLTLDKAILKEIAEGKW